jgi:hypothetical protein
MTRKNKLLIPISSLFPFFSGEKGGNGFLQGGDYFCTEKGGNKLSIIDVLISLIFDR